MQKMYHLFLVFCLVDLSCSCDDSLLLVGGQDASGPLSSMHLLTPSGWCQDIDFPALPEPVTNPGVHIFTLKDTDRHILIVCGFPSDHCKFTENGSDQWNSLPILESGDRVHDYNSTIEKVVSTSRSFQIVALDNQILVMVSTKEGDSYVGNTHTNNLDWHQNQEDDPHPWTPAEDQTAEFSLPGFAWNGAFSKNMTGSCLAMIGKEMLLTGGRTSELPMDMNSRVKSSDATVGRMSPEGAIDCDAAECGPRWEQGVVPDLMEGRDDHGCLGTIVDGVDVVMVGGGTKFDYIKGKSSYTHYTERETYATLRSVEVFHDRLWRSGPDFNEPRLGFGFGDLCGEVVAMGGRQYDGVYMWERIYSGPPDCGEPCWFETVTDTIEELFLDTMETMEGEDIDSLTWKSLPSKLPFPMANFGVANAPLSICKY
eukprot:GFUD01017017.1.p1 GENE.GFUD01017017.1~~GFUD01017017.1.p1  ORF type:complete len:427 (+),score=92.81 GFUD01017017.1:69-1349(+)